MRAQYLLRCDEDAERLCAADGDVESTPLEEEVDRSACVAWVGVREEADDDVGFGALESLDCVDGDVCVVVVTMLFVLPSPSR